MKDKFLNSIRSLTSPVSLEDMISHVMTDLPGISRAEVKNIILDCILLGQVVIEDQTLRVRLSKDDKTDELKSIVKELIVLIISHSSDLSVPVNELLRRHLDYLASD